jgi:hypothetical protein
MGYHWRHLFEQSAYVVLYHGRSIDTKIRWKRNRWRVRWASSCKPEFIPKSPHHSSRASGIAPAVHSLRRIPLTYVAQLSAHMSFFVASKGCCGISRALVHGSPILISRECIFHFTSVRSIYTPYFTFCSLFLSLSPFLLKSVFQSRQTASDRKQCSRKGRVTRETGTWTLPPTERAT